MSDFFTNLLNRHEGVGVQVQPRPNFIFEQPDSSPDVNVETGFSLSSETSRTNEENEVVERRTADMGSKARVFTDQDLDREKLAGQGEEREHFFETSVPVLTPGRPERSGARSEFSEGAENVLKRQEPQSEETLPRQETDSSNKREGERFPHIIMETDPSFFTVPPKKSLPAGKTPDRNIINTVITPLIKQPGESEHSPGSPADLIKPRKAAPGTGRGKFATKDRQPDYKARPDERAESHAMDAPPWLKRFDELCDGLKAQSTQPEPVINVTIGRVEVRAVQGQAQKKTKEAAKPSGVMSLDEYLRQRESRSRK